MSMPRWQREITAQTGKKAFEGMLCKGKPVQ